MKPRRNCLVLLMVGVIVGCISARTRVQAAQTVAANITLWDTGTPFAGAAALGNRASWKVVPSNLLLLEADPAKASSDPGYYGRAYEFQGDAVVENRYLTAAILSGQGKVVVSSKDSKLEIGDSQRKTIRRCVVVQNTGDSVTLEVVFSTGAEGGDRAVVLVFDKTPIVEIQPGAGMKEVGLSCPVEYAVLPGFVGDDLVLAPGQYPSDSTLYLPIENLLLGLLQGENSVLVMTWPTGKQQMRLGLGRQGPPDRAEGVAPSKEGTQARAAGRLIESIDFDTGGQSVYVALLDAPGIWHREALGAAYLERRVASRWKKPFPAKWVTPLYEGQVKTTYAFRDGPGDIWRGVAGRYSYPVWFQGDTTFYHLSKKVPPKGESIVYFLEGQDTPASVWTPVDILKAALGRQACDDILDVAGRELRTHHRRGAQGIRRACTCGCTEAIEAVFKAGQEIEKKAYIEGAVGDMVYFVTRHVERLNEYRAFADNLLPFLGATAAAQPELKTYLDDLAQIVRQIPDQYAVQQENLKSLPYADELSRRTLALLQKKDPKNLPACLELGKDWRGMGGAQDALLAEYHIVVRKLFQEAGYRCLNQPKATDAAREIRNRCRQCLRNPDGYEIWPDY